MLPSESKDCQSNIDAASLKLKLFKNSTAAEEMSKVKDPLSSIITYSDDEEDVGAEADFSNLETNITVSPITTTRVHKDHPVTQIIGDLSSAPQTRSMTRMVKDKEEGIDYEEVFDPVARIKAISLFLSYASFMGFMVYQMDVKSAFFYETIEEEVYVCQPPGFEDLDYPDNIINWSKHSMGCIKLLELGMRRWPTIFWKMVFKGERLIRPCSLKVKQKEDGIFISQDKYVAKILRKFGLTDGKSTSTSIVTEKPLLKDPDGEDVDVHTY
nr:hypothetical protein [Tanacetum cinerariifolium]